MSICSAELIEAPFKFFLLGNNPRGQNLIDVREQGPQLINGHVLKLMVITNAQNPAWVGAAAAKSSWPEFVADSDYRACPAMDSSINRPSGFVCRTKDSTLGLSHLASKDLKFRNLRSECLKVLAQSETTIIQSRTIIHCTPLYQTRYPGRSAIRPASRLGKFGDLLCSLQHTIPAELA
ncbi:hypothetical protein [Bradyrhizobium daqingense]|uniref:hypothetical protein n=1 Tax=Bradyrhizobium daqingense TaxID=993502 RepID=UPI003833972A